jgi:hypothetical protein
MRILIIAAFFPPKNAVASHRPYSWAKYWSDAGHDVTVFTTEKVPSFDDSTYDCSGFKVLTAYWLPQQIQKLNVRGVEGAERARQSAAVRFVKRIVNSLLTVVTSIQGRYGIFLAQRRPDLFFLWEYNAKRVLGQRSTWDFVISTHGPSASHSIAYHLKKKGLTKRWIADYRDLWTDNYPYSGLWPFNLYESWLEKKLLKKADAATTVSEPLAKTLQHRYPNLPVFTVENGFEPADLSALTEQHYFPVDGKIRIVYTGWIQWGLRDPSPLFEAIRSLESEREATKQSTPLALEVLFVGPPTLAVKELTTHYGIERYVRQIGVVTRSTALQIQRDADILLFLEWKSNGQQGLFSGKIFEYMSSGTEIWAIGGANDVSVAELIQKSNTGKHFANNVDRIAAELRSVLERGSKRPVVPDNEYLHQFTRKNKAEIMFRIASQGALE